MDKHCGKCSKPEWAVGILNNLHNKDGSDIYCGRCTVIFLEELLRGSSKKDGLKFIGDNLKTLLVELLLFKFRNPIKFKLLPNRIKSLI